MTKKLLLTTTTILPVMALSATATSCMPGISRGSTPQDQPTPPGVIEKPTQKPDPTKPWGVGSGGQDNFDKFKPKVFASAAEIPAPTFSWQTIIGGNPEVSSVSYFWDYFMNNVLKKKWNDKNEYRKFLEEWSTNGLDKLAVAFSNENKTNEIFKGFYFLDSPEVTQHKDRWMAIDYSGQNNLYLNTWQKGKYRYQKLIYNNPQEVKNISGPLDLSGYFSGAAIPMIKTNIMFFDPGAYADAEKTKQMKKSFVGFTQKRLTDLNDKYLFSFPQKTERVSRLAYEYMQKYHLNWVEGKFAWEYLPNYSTHMSIEKHSAINKDWMMFQFLARMTDVMRMLVDPLVIRILGKYPAYETQKTFVKLKFVQTELTKLRYSNNQTEDEKEFFHMYGDALLKNQVSKVLQAIHGYFDPHTLIAYQEPDPNTTPTKDKYRTMKPLHTQDLIEDQLYKQNAVSVEMISLYNNLFAPLYQMWDHNSYDMSSKGNIVSPESKHFFKNLKMKFPNYVVEFRDYKYNSDEYNEQENKMFDILVNNWNFKA